MGEDFGEEIFDFAAFDHINEAKKRKVIRSLHKFRERLQVLNEDLDVCIFNGEEDFDDEEKQQPIGDFDLKVEEQFKKTELAY